MTKNAKVKLRITPYEIDGIDSNGVPFQGVGSDELSCTSFYEIPCGKCIGCRSDQAREWSNRLIMEMKYHDSAYFITLTYSEEFLNRVNYVDKMTGELKMIEEHWIKEMCSSLLKDYVITDHKILLDIIFAESTDPKQTARIIMEYCLDFIYKTGYWSRMADLRPANSITHAGNWNESGEMDSFRLNPQTSSPANM